MSDATDLKQFTPKQAKIAPDIRGKTRKAIEIMAHTGASKASAAKQAEVKPSNLTRSLQSPQGQILYKHLVKQVRENAAQAAYLKINHLTENAQSERLKYDASRWVAGVDGISPVQKVQGQHHHNHQFGGFEYVRPDVIEGQTTDTPSAAPDPQGTDNND